jgi:hypothetical protein
MLGHSHCLTSLVLAEIAVLLIDNTAVSSLAEFHRLDLESQHHPARSSGRLKSTSRNVAKFSGAKLRRKHFGITNASLKQVLIS